MAEETPSGTEVIAAEPDRTLVERVLGGDWRSAALVAAPTVLTAYALALLACIVLWWTGDDDVFTHSSAGYFHSAGALMAMAMGSPIFVSSGGDGGGHFFGGMAPLTITFVVIAVFAMLLRSYLPDEAPTNVRVASALRATLLTALGLALASISAYVSEGTEDGRVHLSSSPGRVFGWSLLIFGVTGVLVASRPFRALDARSASDVRIARLRDHWSLPARGALAALTTAVVLGGVTGLIIFFVESSGDRLGVAKALPLFFAYFVNLGVDVFHLSMGAPLHESFSGRGSSSSLFDRNGIPAGYLLLFVLPPICVAAGVQWMRRNSGNVTPELLSRACYRMTLPAMLGYLVLAVPSRAGFGAADTGELGGSGHAGVHPLYGALILAAWFLILGFAAGRYVLQHPTGKAPGEPKPFRWTRRMLRAESVAIVAGVVAVIAAAGGIATAKDGKDSNDFGLLGAAFFFGMVSSDAEVSGGSVTVSPPPVYTPPSVAPLPALPTSTAADELLRSAAVGEETYFTDYQTYTADQTQLQVSPQPGVVLTIPRADATAFCLEAFTDNGETYTYDSTTRAVVVGANC